VSGLAIFAAVILYVFTGMIFVRVLVRQGVLTIQNVNGYGILALLWPLLILLLIYLLFSGMVHALAEV